jgi:hypothetical protein
MIISLYRSPRQIPECYILQLIGKNITNQNTKIAILAVLAITLTAAVTAIAQPVKAFPIGPCSFCAKDFAPGKLKKALPLPACSGCNGASDFVPGHIKKQPSTTTFR